LLVPARFRGRELDGAPKVRHRISRPILLQKKRPEMEEWTGVLIWALPLPLDGRFVCGDRLFSAAQRRIGEPQVVLRLHGAWLEREAFLERVNRFLEPVFVVLRPAEIVPTFSV
jgi:hypothetical protein